MCGLTLVNWFFLSNYSVLHKDFDYSINSTTYILYLIIKDKTPFETITNFKMFKVFHFFMIRFDIIMHRTVLLIQVTKVRDLCLQNSSLKIYLLSLDRNKSDSVHIEPNTIFLRKNPRCVKFLTLWFFWDFVPFLYLYFALFWWLLNF